MVDYDKINPIKSISRYIRPPLVVALEHLPPKVAKKRRKTHSVGANYLALDRLNLTLRHCIGSSQQPLIMFHRKSSAPTQIR